MIRIKSSTNTENFIKIWDHFCTVWLRSGGITLLLHFRNAGVSSVKRTPILLETFSKHFLRLPSTT
jgi:hypothetical protein